MKRVAVVGAGWAGLAAAVTLAGRARVTLIDAGREPGGRARRVRLGGMDVDNGQHILLGAYRQTLALMRRVGADPDALLLRQPLTWVQQGGVELVCPRWPAPLHVAAGLLGARGLSWRDKWALARALDGLKRQGWRVAADRSVADWLRDGGQGAAAVEGFWRPLVLSALNTPLEQASLAVLAAVLRDSLGAARADSDLLLPRADLSALFPDPAWRWLGQQGVTLCPGRRVAGLALGGAGAVVDGERFDAVVCATAPYHAARLLGQAAPSMLQQLDFQPIYTVYLKYDETVRLPRPMLGLKGSVAHWFFDRGQLTGDAGLVAAVISSAGEHEAWPQDRLVAALDADVRRLAGHASPLRDARVVVEKRATFASRVGLARPGPRLGVKYGYIAGDWVVDDYPATLEGAVRSGVDAALAALQDMETNANNRE